MEHNPNQTDLLSEDLTKPRIVVVIPAYNEERFIASVVLKARRYSHQVIVVDDGSRDETARLALEAGAKVVSHTHNQGKGTALHSGFTAAQAENPEVIVMLDADGQHCPEELGRMISPILAGEADIVVGSRYIQQTSNIPLHRVWGHHIFNLLTGAASGTHSSDSQSGFRAFSPSALGVFAFCSPGFSVESEMQFIAHEHHLRLVEVPITIRYTDKPKRPVWQHGLLVINGIMRFAGQYRPLLFFGLPGLLILVAGMGMGVVVVDIYRDTQQLAVGYAMISVLMSVMGMIGFSMGVILHSVRGLLIEFLATRLSNGNHQG